MATEEKQAPKGEDKAQDDADFLKEAHERYDAAYQRDRENIEAAYDDLAFLIGENQWTPEARAIREAEGRPCHTINALPTYTRQITGDIRQMRPAVTCVPVDDHGDPETAEAMGGVIRYIENRSKAQIAVYSKVADSQVACGVGHWRVRTEYSSPATLNQDLRLEAIEDGVAVLWDPDATEQTREDARYCFVPVDMSRAGFKARYPGKIAQDFGTSNYAKEPAAWASDDHIRVAEYWFKKAVKHHLVMLKDGSVFDLDDTNEERAATAEAIAKSARIRGDVVREVTRDIDEVWRAVISCGEVLEEPTRWPGRYIPIIPVFGNEVTIGRKVVRFGAIRFSKDAQRSYNYASSAQTEVVALQPKSPFIGTEKNFENYQDVWETANTVNHPYLPYTPDPANNGAAPQRVQPAVASSGLAQEIQRAHDDIQRTIGIYNAGLGAAGPEHSGRAILARQREGDVGSFVYVSNFGLAIQHTGTILVDLIPHIYDTARTLRITGEDGKTEELHVNKPVGAEFDGQPEKVMNDLTVGAYDVAMSMGPSYTTRREEARDGMREFMQTSPEMVSVIGDLYAKAQEWPMADDIGKRLRKIAPPPIQELIAEEEAESNPVPPQPKPPSPEEQMQQASMEMDMRAKQLDLRTKDAQARKAEADAAKAEAEAQATLVAPLMPQAAPAPVSAPQDGRVDELANAVMGIQETLQAVIQAIQPMLQPPMEPEPPQPDYPQFVPQEPSPEGFFNGPPDPNGQPLA